MKRRRLLLRAIAEVEMANAHNGLKIYSAQRASRFLTALDECLERIQAYPLACVIIRGTMRRALIRGFDYTILYVLHERDEENDDIIILGCVHTRSDPQSYLSRSEE